MPFFLHRMMQAEGAWSSLNLMCKVLLTPIGGLTLAEELGESRVGEWKDGLEGDLWLECKLNLKIIYIYIIYVKFIYIIYIIVIVTFQRTGSQTVYVG